MDWVQVWRLATVTVSAVVVVAVVMFIWRYVNTLNAMKKELEASGSTMVAPPKVEVMLYHGFFAAYLVNNCVGTIQRLDQHAAPTFSLWPTPFILLGLLFFLRRFYYKYTAIMRAQ